MTAKTNCVAAGDVFITRRLPDSRYEGFEEFRKLLLQHELRFANLEILFLKGEGYPGSSTGTFAWGPPDAIEDVKSYGFNLFNAAMNHALDFSHNGLVAHLGYLRQYGITYAGAGENMALASAPVYFEGKSARIGLVGVCSSIGDNLPAGIQRADMLGRPGVNYLGHETRYYLTTAQMELLKCIAKDTDINSAYEILVGAGFRVPSEEGFNFGGHMFYEREKPGKETRVREKDMERVVSSIREIRRQADYAMVSIHSHETSEFLNDFCRRCIDAGASAVIGHGSHVVRGVELYGNGVIFYSLGNVLFENDTVRIQPPEFFENYSLPADSQVGEGIDARDRNSAAAREKRAAAGTTMSINPGKYKTVLASWDMEDGRVHNIRLYPVDLGSDLPRYRRGLPALSKDESILDYMDGLSREYNTGIDIRDGVGYVKSL